MDNRTAELLGFYYALLQRVCYRDDKRAKAEFLLFQEGTAGFDSGAVLCALC
jgi:hypothetical protein